MNIKTLPLIKKATGDGLIEVIDRIQIGRQYSVDIDNMIVQSMYNVDKRIVHQKLMVWDVDEGGYFPAELLGIEDQKTTKGN